MREAIAERNARYDQTFLYGVITTGVFCLPSCAARPARPENLRFFFDSQQAQKAGLRACKRCRPLDAPAEQERLVELARYIAKHADQKLTLSELAKRVALNPTTLQKRFSALFGVSPRAFQDHERNQRLKTSLRAQQSITDSIQDAGYGSASRAKKLAMPRATRRWVGSLWQQPTRACASPNLATAQTRLKKCSVRSFPRLSSKDLQKKAGRKSTIGCAHSSSIWSLRHHARIYRWIYAAPPFKFRSGSSCCRYPLEQRGTGCGFGVRREQYRGVNPLPSRSAWRWQPRRVPLGNAAQATPPGSGNQPSALIDNARVGLGKLQQIQT